MHLFGAIHGMRVAIPIMRAQNYGRIINTLSRAAELNAPGSGSYSAAKAGMWAATCPGSSRPPSFTPRL